MLHLPRLCSSFLGNPKWFKKTLCTHCTVCTRQNHNDKVRFHSELILDLLVLVLLVLILLVLILFGLLGQLKRLVGVFLDELGQGLGAGEGTKNEQRVSMPPCVSMQNHSGSNSTAHLEATVTALEVDNLLFGISREEEDCGEALDVHVGVLIFRPVHLGNDNAVHLQSRTRSQVTTVCCLTSK